MRCDWEKLAASCCRTVAPKIYSRQVAVSPLSVFGGDHLVQTVVVGGAGGQQSVDVSIEEGLQHLAVVFVESGALGVLDEDHVEDPALSMVGLRIILGHCIFEQLVDPSHVLAIGIGRANHRGREGCGLQSLPNDLDLGELVDGQLRHRGAHVRLVGDQSFAGQGLQTLPDGDGADAEQVGDLADRDGGAQAEWRRPDIGSSSYVSATTV